MKDIFSFDHTNYRIDYNYHLSTPMRISKRRLKEKEKKEKKMEEKQKRRKRKQMSECLLFLHAREGFVSLCHFF
jgi:hypothetical protein